MGSIPPAGTIDSKRLSLLFALLDVLAPVAPRTIDGATYTVDNAGNRTSKTDKQTNVTTTYGYDAIDQLVSATQGASTTESFTYDPVGNRTASLGVPSYTNNTSNELTATSNASYGYDNNGNAVTKNDSTGITTYAWDFEDRLTSVTLPGTGGTVSFKYDPFGRRIYKSSSAGSSIFAYDGDNQIEETNSSGAVVARYSQGLNIDEPLAMLRSAATSYYNADALGSVTSLADPSGTLAQTYTLDSFGRRTASSGSLTNSFQYTGREFDPETGLHFYRARYYDPTVGRFLTEDPMRYRTGVDFYTYVLNNPIRYTDPKGECPQLDSVSRWHLECEKSVPGVQLSKEKKCACHCVYAPEAPPGQGCMDVCMDCYAKSPTPYDACLCFAKRLAGRTNEQAESDCSSLKKRKWWWPW